MTFEPFTGPGSTPERRRFWDDAMSTVEASRKLPGKNVTVYEDPTGTLISVPDSRKKGSTGACCLDGDCSITTEAGCAGFYRGGGTTCEDVTCPPSGGACCHIDGTCTIETSGTCDGAYQGDNVPCEDADCVHTGACCVDGVCSITRREDCAGTYQGDGTDCDPNPCTVPCSECAFLNPCDGLYYLTQTITGSGNFHIPGDPDNDWDFTSEAIYSCSGGVVSCGGGGSGNFTIGGVFNDVITGSCDVGDTNTFAALGGLPAWIFDLSGNCSPCPKSDGWTLNIDDCDHKQYIRTDISGASGTVDAFVAYSNPCTP